MNVFDLRNNLAEAVVATAECNRVRAAAPAMVIDYKARRKAAS
jgi:hypothetical protein